MMRNSQRLHAPRLPTRFTHDAGANHLLQDFAEFAAIPLDRADFTAQSAAHVTFTGVLCKQGRWTESRLQGVRCTDTRLEGCDLANAAWERLTAHRVEFLTSQLVGFTALEAHLQHVRFQGCNAQFAGFRFATCKSVRFEQCDLRHADFQRADLSGVVFHKCDLSHAQLSGATLKGTDFRGSKIDEMRVGMQELPGAIVDPFQAAYIAGLLGVIIKGEGDE
ncbi:MAG: pentapeptide repeat-containing protein [Caldilinea sp. CFX5]|nr:pentapeptide repeat-containing protein [Caldilinea sp. CFX5]